jgi:hypothetical protein
MFVVRTSQAWLGIEVSATMAICMSSPGDIRNNALVVMIRCPCQILQELMRMSPTMGWGCQCMEGEGEDMEAHREVEGPCLVRMIAIGVRDPGGDLEEGPEDSRENRNGIGTGTGRIFHDEGRFLIDPRARMVFSYNVVSPIVPK